MTCRGIGCRNMSDLWDEIWSDPLYFPRVYWYAEEFLEYLVKWSMAKQGGLFLELGAGSGRFSHFLSRKGIEVVALDYSSNSVKLLLTVKKRSKVDFHVIRAEVSKVPFRNSVFSVVYSEGLLEHFRNLRSVLMEATRVTRQYGIVVFSVPNKFSFHTFGRFVVVKLMRLKWRYGFERSFSREEARHALISIGLGNIEFHGIGLLYGVGRYLPRRMRTCLYSLHIRIRGTKLGVFLTEHFGFQIVGKGEKLRH